MTMKYLTQFEQTARQLPQDVMETGRRVWLAGMGAVGMLGNTTTTLFDTLVEEGKRFQQVELKAVDKAVTSTTATMTGAWNDAATYVQTNVQAATKAAMSRLGMPTRKDVADLTARVETLTAKVEALLRKGATHVG
jgi:poly(hydroxyalkanoate) granule-associated protein